MNPTFSIVIPTYECYGKGKDFLKFSFEIFKNQTFKDFEIIISDHSKDDEIEKLCNEYSYILDIKYYKNIEKRGNSSSNLNNGIRKASGKWIKILFQDDYFFNEKTMKIYYNLIKESEKKWLLTSYKDTKDNGKTFTLKHIPFITFNFKFRKLNTMGSPSILTFKNEDNNIFFNEKLIWVMDVEYFFRLYKKLGNPIICDEITIIHRQWENNLTQNIKYWKKKFEEYYLFYLYNKRRYKLIRIIFKVIEDFIRYLKIKNT